MTPTLSICIANYEGEDVIARCLDSVMSQSCDFDFEVIVHDDASTDTSIEIIQHKYPDVVLLKSETNRGYCESNNLMAEQAHGDYLLLLNNDTRLHPDSLQTLMDEAKRSPDTGVLSLPQYDMASGELLDRGLLLDLFCNPIPALEPAPEVALVMGSCLWIRRDLWNEVGGLPSWFGSLAEDTYLCARVRLLGFKVRVIENGAYDHVVGHSFGGGKVKSDRLATSYKRRRLSELNKNRVIAACYPAPLHLLVLPLQFMLLLVEGTLLSVAKRSMRPLREIYLPSIGGILSDIPRLSRERAIAMAARRASLRDFLRTVKIRHHKLTLLGRHGVPDIS